MTLKEWFHEHTNITQVLFLFGTFWMIVLTADAFHAERWGWAVVLGLGALSWAEMTVNWWKRYQ